MDYYILYLLATALSTTGLKIKQHDHRGDKRVINGRVGQISDWPFLVYLNYQQPVAERKICGGVLIDSFWVLTAAQCVYQIVDRPDFLTVAIGRNDRSSFHDKKNFTVSRIIPRAEYMYRMTALFHGKNMASVPNGSKRIGEGLLNDDIALVKLSRPARVADIRNKLSLPRPWEVRDNLGMKDCKIAGWGHTLPVANFYDVSKPSFIPPLHFHVLSVPLINNTECKSKIKHVNPKDITDHVICCGGNSLAKFNGTAGQGDSGSPVVCKGRNGQRTLFGIVMYGESSCQPGKDYFLATRISIHYDWIRQTMIDY